jgi:membrane protein DedA with SNARE-associated domain
MFQFLIELKYVAIFLGTFVEGPTIGLLVGLFAKLGYLSLFLGYLVHVIADLSADFLFYAIGYFGGKKALHKVAKYLKFSVKETENAEKTFNNNGKKIILIGKITHVVGFPILIAAGLAKYPFWKFAIFDLIATLIKSAILIAVGYYFGNFWIKIHNVLLDVGFAGVLIILVPLIYFIIKRRGGKGKNQIIK